uniref:Hydantoinase B/oxoprolinase n=1 Tax=Candidatus Kentrum sp. LFY TaxID=2126342 RepID=A0A450V7N5_9GAMM|nr:MAG: Hydantoinase B/oxoprolinase [Candidatus Kentron sp. LFY]
MAGGEPGKTGWNWVERADGSREELASTEEVTMETGDVFVIETPGGGRVGVIQVGVAEIKTYPAEVNAKLGLHLVT